MITCVLRERGLYFYECVPPGQLFMQMYPLATLKDKSVDSRLIPSPHPTFRVTESWAWSGNETMWIDYLSDFHRLLNFADMQLSVRVSSSQVRPRYLAPPKNWLRSLARVTMKMRTSPSTSTPILLLGRNLETLGYQTVNQRGLTVLCLVGQTLDCF